MLTEKQNWLETLRRHGAPDRLPNQFRPIQLLIQEPCYQYLYGNRVKGQNLPDRFGTRFLFPADQPGPMPHVTRESKVLPDITRWEEYIQFPSLDFPAAHWDAARAAAEQIDRGRSVLSCMMIAGLFEQLHFWMGFEDTLVNLLLEPEAMQALIAAFSKWRLRHAQLLVENLEPELILSHDDWGAKDRLFMSPDTWREMIKPHYAELYGYLHSRGVKVMHHADSYLEPIVEDLIEIGVDIWQGVLPSNDIERLQKQIDGRMVLMGGIDSGAVDRADATEEEIRAEVRRACRQYGPGGHFIPCLTYGRGASIYPHVYPVIEDEIDRCNGGSGTRSEAAG